MTLHFKILSEFNKLMENYDKSKADNRNLLMSMVLHSADIGNPASEFD